MATPSPLPRWPTASRRVMNWLSRRVWPDIIGHHARWRREIVGGELSWPQRVRLRGRLLVDRHPAMAIPAPPLPRPVAVRVGTSDEYVYEQIFRQREYAIQVPEPATIIDAGANIGLATRWFAHRYPQAKIVAVEPDPANFRMLRENTHHLDNVVCLQAGIWHRSARLRRIQDDAKAWSYRFEETEDAAGLATLGIDGIVAEHFAARVDLVKVDIEGTERDVFAAGGDWLDSVTTVIVECHDRFRPGCQAAVQACFPSDAFGAMRSGENLVFVRKDRSPC